ncbi:hypothetical protein GCM10008085_16610 [Winogradskyella epiphytica]|nr:hypothetical protein [Winogradskyella epiphytica]GGW65157.1 hypothetical protein GCM10008085_16610 [Winogradskyella epiphytica]
MNSKEKASRKTNFGNKVVSGQYILKGMKCFIIETETLEPKKMMTLISHTAELVKAR